MQVYLVYFETGEFDSSQSYVMEVFSSKNSAEEYVLKQNNLLDKLGLFMYGNDSHIRDFEFRHSEKMHKLLGLPEGYDIDYTGANYRMSGPFELRD